MIKSVYIHIPFCNSICSYCDFVRVKNNKSLQDDFIESLLKDISKDENKKIETLYIGGGTPSVLSYKNMEKLLKLLNDKYEFSDNYEFTVEANPEDVNDQIILLFKKYKVNRISMGVQTFNDKLLKEINRLHDSKKVEESIEKIREHGIENLSIDLIYGLPKQTIADIKEDIKMLEKYKIKHLSWYSLIPKEGSQLFDYKQDEDLLDEMLGLIQSNLKRDNYINYEISSYSKNEDCFSKHNINYWMSENWIAFGPGAHWHVDGNLFENNNKINKWDTKKNEQTKDEKNFQTIMMGLRFYKGLDLKNKRHKEATIYFDSIIKKQIKENKLKLEKNRLFVSEQYFLLLDEILLDYINL